jgi:hypothetical protein
MPPEFLSDASRDAVEKSFEGGVGVATNVDGRKLVLLCDSWNGRYFESFTDASVYFLPSELELVPEQFEEMASFIVEEKMLRLPKEEAAVKETKKKKSLLRSHDIWVMGKIFLLFFAWKAVWLAFFGSPFSRTTLLRQKHNVTVEKSLCVDIVSPSENRVDCDFW